MCVSCGTPMVLMEHLYSCGYLSGRRKEMVVDDAIVVVIVFILVGTVVCVG